MTADAMTMTVPTPARPRARALVLLLVYLVGCAFVAAVMAAGLGLAWQEFLGWAQPHLTPTPLP